MKFLIYGNTETLPTTEVQELHKYKNLQKLMKTKDISSLLGKIRS